MVSFLCNFDDYLQLSQKVARLEAQLAQSNVNEELHCKIAALEAQSTQANQDLELLKKIAVLESQLAHKQKDNQNLREALVCLATCGYCHEGAHTREAGPANTALHSTKPYVETCTTVAGGDLLNLNGQPKEPGESSGYASAAAGNPSDESSHTVSFSTADCVGHAASLPQHQSLQDDSARLDRRAPSTELERRADFSRFGIRYCPAALSSKTRQRVLIQNLPVGVSLKAVLDKVWGGMLIECLLLDTSAVTPGSWTALVRFRHEGSALQFSRVSETYPPIIDGKKIHVRHIKTHSYPLPPDMGVSVYDHGLTRCLRGRCASMHHKLIRTSLETAGLGAAHVLAELISEPDGRFEIHFASIWYARRAREFLDSTGPRCDYTEDPCSRQRPRPFDEPVAPLDANEPLFMSQDTDQSFSSSGTVPLTPVASLL